MDWARETLADFPYGTAQDSAGLPVRITIFADNPRVRSEIAADMNAVGFSLVSGREIADLLGETDSRSLNGPAAGLGDVVLIDCPGGADAAAHGGLDARSLAALARLDMRIARSGAQLIVSTSMEALDDVFGVVDQSRPQILVQPSRAERIVAVGRVLTGVAHPRVRELAEHDRVALLRLSQQIDEIARELDRISTINGDGAGRLSDFKPAYAPADDNPVSLLGKATMPAPRALPDPRLVRQMIAARQARARFFEGELFADPAWDMLLDLTAAHAENARVSVSSLCIAAGVPATTALRWLSQMVDMGIFTRVADPDDRRRAFIELTDRSLDAMARYFEAVDAPLAIAA